MTVSLALQEDSEVRAVPEDMQQALLDSGADSRLLKLSWVENNLRWVMWKLVSLAEHLEGKRSQLLSFDVVLDEMKKRSAISWLILLLGYFIVITIATPV